MAKIKVGGKKHEGGLSYKGITIKWDEHTPEEIAKIINDLGYIPPAAVRRTVRSEAEKVKTLARNYAPRRTGALRVGLVVGKIERTTTPGKVVYDVRLSREMNEVFVKTSRITGNRAYYPSSMEYGFKLRNGKKYVGKHYLKEAATTLMPYSEQLMYDGIYKKIEAIWNEQNRSDWSEK